MFISRELLHITLNDLHTCMTQHLSARMH
jgi:hypothetical protein